MLKDFMTNKAPLLYTEPTYHSKEQRVNCVGIRYEKDHYVIDCYNVHSHSIIPRIVYANKDGWYIYSLASQEIIHFDLEDVKEKLNRSFRDFSSEFITNLASLPYDT